jgi:hypothetical protein
MGEYSKALSYLKRAVSILQCSLPASHPNIQRMQQNMKLLKKKSKNNI